MLQNSTHEILAARIFAALKTRRPIAPISGDEPAFNLDDAYKIAATLVERRIKAGEAPAGWKIGFTNRTIWDEYGVRAPIWGRTYDTTIQAVDALAPVTLRAALFQEPRLEPEIVFRVGRSPEPGMEGADLLLCLDGVAHGFEIVQSIYPGWKFTAADTAAAFGLHGRLLIGPIADLSDGNRGAWLARLADFEIALYRGDSLIDRGKGANVLDGPLSALAHFIAGLDRVSGERLRPGEVVTTGTVTRAMPVAAGETWRSEIVGLPLPGITLRFA